MIYESKKNKHNLLGCMSLKNINEMLKIMQYATNNDFWLNHSVSPELFGVVFYLNFLLLVFSTCWKLAMQLEVVISQYFQTRNWNTILEALFFTSNLATIFLKIFFWYGVHYHQFLIRCFKLPFKFFTQCSCVKNEFSIY